MSKRTFIQIFPTNEGFVNSGKVFKAKNSLKAAKKAFRESKNLEVIYLYEKDTKKIFSHPTKDFFTVKKAFQFQRNSKSTSKTI